MQLSLAGRMDSSNLFGDNILDLYFGSSKKRSGARGMMKWLQTLLLLQLMIAAIVCDDPDVEQAIAESPGHNSNVRFKSSAIPNTSPIHFPVDSTTRKGHPLEYVFTSKLKSFDENAVNRMSPLRFNDALNGSFNNELHREIGNTSSQSLSLLETAGFLPDCKGLIASEQSKRFFYSRLEATDACFIQFAIDFDNKTVRLNFTRDAFLAKVWFWSYTSVGGKHPYLNWPIDHGVLSFGLLSYRTASVPFVKLMVNPPQKEVCKITLGTQDASMLISEALAEVIHSVSKNSYNKFPVNYFCYLAEAPGIRDSVVYYLALYTGFPVAFINYKCCTSIYFFSNNSFVQDCSELQMKKWNQSVIGPYILGVVIAVYFPILLFRLSAWLSEHEPVSENADGDRAELLDFSADNENSDWMFLDGRSPLTVSDVLGSPFTGIKRKYPYALSRVRRLLLLILGPSVIVIQILMYQKGIGVKEHTITVSDLAMQGTPMGFLSVLAHSKDRAKVFVPLLGGPFAVFGVYFALGIAFLVVPRSLKAVTESGLPVTFKYSPLFLGTEDILTLALFRTNAAPGYDKAASLCKASFSMLFVNGFWSRVWEIQKQRFDIFGNRTFLNMLLRIFVYPLLACFCLTEIVICIVYNAVPLFRFVVIMVKGVSLSFLNKMSCYNYFFRNGLTTFVAIVIVFAMFICFVYCALLIFVQSFTFICQIIMFCLVAVIVYPSVAFGYLFFVVVLVYYLVHLVRDFGDGYLVLLSTVVEQSVILERNLNHVSVQEDRLVISNLRITGIRSIHINDTVLDTPHNVLSAITRASTPSKTKTVANTQGIPKKLFWNVVKQFRPVHREILSLVFHITVIVAFVGMTRDITSSFAPGPTSEISEVMHVVFVVIIGALPRVLELAMTNESGIVKKEIHEREIEQHIIQYWQEERKAEHAIIRL
ncbi:hypothetical protein DPMN_093192 [Dreissena polymorpha]|uniref:Uncharacterized protein n=2 Tax=Dreissena polymorpha TaxID=45954 RepID=A0A9D4L3M6_DREPO|nr:hypothetical protein DPMN_093192 [Dreissena polymorpha]